MSDEIERKAGRAAGAAEDESTDGGTTDEPDFEGHRSIAERHTGMNDEGEDLGDEAGRKGRSAT